ncbi:hypothetical protein YPPY03_2728, partial [Yersinia pestis PY-03]
MTELLHAA